MSPHPKTEPASASSKPLASLPEPGFQPADIPRHLYPRNANVAAIGFISATKRASISRCFATRLRGAAGRHSHPGGAKPAARRSAPPDDPPMLHRITAGASAAPAARMMAHELAQPTAALDQVVQEVIGPDYAAMANRFPAFSGAARR